MKEELKNIIDELKAVIEETDLKNIFDKDILEFSIRIYNSNNIESGKNKRTQEIKENKIKTPATEGQIKILRKLNYTEEEIKNMSKGQAWKIINDANKKEEL